MKAKHFTALVALWAALLIIACGREIIAPQTVSGPRSVRALHPKPLALAAENLYRCAMVAVDGNGSTRKYRRATGSIEGSGRPSLDPKADKRSVDEVLTRVHVMMWERRSGELLHEASCVVPRTHDAVAFAKGNMKETAARMYRERNPKAAANLSVAWEGIVYCTGDFENGFLCDGEWCDCGGDCQPVLENGNVTSAAAANSTLYYEFQCGNDCEILVDENGVPIGYYGCPEEEPPPCEPYEEGCCWNEQYQVWEPDPYGDACEEDENGGGGGGQATASLFCTPSGAGLIRGGQTMCEVRHTGSAIVIDGWTFTPAAGSDLPEVTDSRTDTTWGGLIVSAGTVKVDYRKGDSTSKTATFNLTLTPRTWTAYFADPPAIGGPFSLENDQPTIPDHLGRTELFVTSGSASVITPPSGPNTGYVAQAAMPVAYNLEVFINTGQLKNTSALAARHDLHPSGGNKMPDGYCSRQYIAFVLRGEVEAHEGLALQAGSHTKWYQNFFSTNKTAIQQRVEALVYFGDGLSPEPMFTKIVGKSSTTLKDENIAAVHGAMGQRPCTIRFF